MLETAARRFRDDVAPRVDFWSIRVVAERTEELSVVRNVAEAPRTSDDLGAMVTIVDGGGCGYAATPDLGVAGLRRAAEEAAAWARRSAGRLVFDPALTRGERASGDYETGEAVPWSSTPLREKLDRLRRESERLKSADAIAEWAAAVAWSEMETVFATSDGAFVRQRFRFLLPLLHATAARGDDSETRTFGGHAWCRQGGLETLDAVGFFDAAPRVAEEALELLAAPQCPSGTMDVVVAPDQMILQVHESIGHPLELDRILGDERNYAGRSFVTPDMFGRYRYGSELLNVTFDPTVGGELASYAFDDEGTPARREYLIRAGLLVRALGGRISQARSGVPGVACSRARSWNRAPIDRMANVNLEAGASSLASMIRATERGVHLETNRSWSIDDSRRKFQFGCERARRIVDGELRDVVRNACYRGVTAEFWQRLAAVGDASTRAVLGTPYCGKGEPNQAMRAGHVAPACRFTDVDVFGGEAREARREAYR